jgi:hypothetical protein
VTGVAVALSATEELWSEPLTASDAVEDDSSVDVDVVESLALLSSTCTAASLPVVADDAVLAIAVIPF